MGFKERQTACALLALTVAIGGCASEPVSPPVTRAPQNSARKLTVQNLRRPAASAPAAPAAKPKIAQRPDSDHSDQIRFSRAAPTPVNSVPDGSFQYRLPYGIVIAGVRLRRVDFDFPVRVNQQVERWVRYFTGRGRENFQKWLERSEYMAPEILPMLRDHGLPEDLVYLSLIESGFSFHAVSNAEAVGPWQFIPETGRRYGLHIDWWLDERRDVQKSTKAAARYLADLYHEFGSWELAAAAYNAGEKRVERAIGYLGTRDFWRLARRPHLSPETREYVPKIMAAAIVGKNREAYGFRRGSTHLGDDQAWKARTVQVDVPGPVDLLKVARAAGMAYRDVKHLNPEILRWCSPPSAQKVTLRLPEEARGRFEAAYHRPNFVRDVEFRPYRVRPGDTLARIARRFGVRVEPLQELNGIVSHAALEVGGQLRLPLPADRVFSTTAEADSTPILTPEIRQAAQASSSVEGI
ncbi:MAG TPA: transglycosylase SLT domain-containing protein [Bdellovibrionota bacterium]|nr:transglycosylase SLT domain-containing protein [Bdellovibrionota bacterium]